MSKLKAGDRVKVKATCFDQEGHPRWNEAAFGFQCKTSFCSGSLVKTVGRGAAEVVWDIDGSVTKVPVAVLSVIESTKETDSFRSSSASDDHNPDFSESSSSSEEEENSPASADSSDDSEGLTSELTVDPGSNVHESATASRLDMAFSRWNPRKRLSRNVFQQTTAWHRKPTSSWRDRILEALLSRGRNWSHTLLYEQEDAWKEESSFTEWAIQGLWYPLRNDNCKPADKTKLLVCRGWCFSSSCVWPTFRYGISPFWGHSACTCF